MRLSTRDGIKGFFFVHGLYGDKVNGAFEEIVTYLKAHETEIVILDMQHFYQFTQDDHNEYIRLLMDVFSDMICPAAEKLEIISLNWMREHGYQVVIVIFYLELADVCTK